MTTRISVAPHIVGNPLYFRHALDNHKSGIFLASENSLYDADKIDTLYYGCVSPEAVNLESMEGNGEVLSNIERMLSERHGSFFPGTLLRDFGGYVVPVMPIILGGKLVCERVKQTGIPYVDDYNRLANEIGIGNSKQGRSHQLEYDKLLELANRDLNRRRKESLRAFLIGDIPVLPVICNELDLMPSMYKGQSVSLVLHSCSNYNSSMEDRVEKYSQFARAMRDRGLINDPLTIVYSENSSANEMVPSSKGAFRYEQGRLKLVDEKHPGKDAYILNFASKRLK